MKERTRAHWEVNSICPKCLRTNHIIVPVGRHVVRVACSHCRFGYEYTHIVEEYEYVPEEWID